MPKNTIISILTGTGAAIFFGMIATILLSILLKGYYQHSVEDFFPEEGAGVIVGMILSVIIPPIFGLGFLLPLSIIDRNKIESLTRKQLLLRYAPLVTLLPGFFTFLVFISSFTYPNYRFSLLSILLTWYCIGCTSLWFFLKRIKS